VEEDSSRHLAHCVKKQFEPTSCFILTQLVQKFNWENESFNPNIFILTDKGCIALCVENMQRSFDLKPLEIVEMFVTVFCFLKDSAEESPTLLEDFRTCQGYIFLTEFLLK